MCTALLARLVISDQSTGPCGWLGESTMEQPVVWRSVVLLLGSYVDYPQFKT